MIFDRYQTTIPGWVTAVEAIAENPSAPDEPTDQLNLFRISLDEDPEFVIGILSLPNGSRPPWLDGNLEIRAGYEGQEPRLIEEEWRFQGPSDDRGFIDESRTIIIVNNPGRRYFEVGLSAATRSPVALNFMAFHGYRGHHHVSTSFKCRACKITAKALALAIVAAAMLPALPAALISAVAAYLGASVVVAAAFIGSVIGDTADVIAEKLCKKVGLC